ncbi:MAG: dUTP diphosphatase [Nanoarchaeota archaeon]|nr:dUTP diphosphatase [Nanoarchaeota archaeon]
MVEVKVHRLDKELEMPKYAKLGDAAFDLRSVEDKVILAGKKELIKTGLRVAVPKNHCGLIWDRSGLAAKHSIHCLAGVLDSGYRGEIVVVLHNLGHEDFKVERSMRIAQMLIQPVVNAKLIEVDELDETERSDKGFASSGLI